MADADLDAIIRQLAKQQTKTLIAAARARRDRQLGLAAKARDAGTRERLELVARTTLEQGTAAARRLQVSADNAADSYARAVRKAGEIAPAAKSAAAQKTPPAKKPVKKSTKKTKA
jgi:hypothetical protein